MATTVGQHSVAAFTSPVNGTTPIDANTVRGNDNTVRVAYVDHDADPGIHVQSSTLASRPTAGTAGRKWITEDSGVYTLWFDDGTNWHPVSSENVALTVLAGENLVKGDVVKVTGWNNGQDLPEVAKVSSASDTAFAIITAAVSSGSMGYATNTGIVQDVNTNSFSAGTILYPNTSGGFTSTKPTSGTYQVVAYVLRQNSNNGVIFVEFSGPRIVERSDNTASTVVLRDASGNFSAGTITAGALTSTGLVTFASLKGTGATTVTNILDEDNMASDSATALATQQSIKAYVDAKVATVDTLAEVLANGNTTGANDIIVNSGQKIRTPLVAAQDGTSAITIANSTGALTLNTALTDSNLATISTAGKVSNSATTATSANTASAIVARDGSGNFTAGTITAALTGNASTATALQTARTINGTSFDGTANITVTAAAGTLTGTTLASNVVSSSLTSVGTLANLTVTNPITGSVTGSSGSTTGNAATATALQTARTINGVSFNGTADITVTAAAGTLTGSTLASGVTASSLTSVGTLTSLTVSGNITASGGTANGVGYLNASKVLTTGTALTFNGSQLEINSLGDQLKLTRTSVGSGTLNIGGSGEIAYAAASHIFYNAAKSTDWMRLDASGNLGLGVTPDAGAKMTVAGGVLSTGAFSATTGSTAGFDYSGGSMRFFSMGTSGSTKGSYSWIAKGADNSSSTPMTLDASGNLGVGTTPAAWEAGKAIQFGTYGAVSSSLQAGVNTQITNNTYFDGTNYRYIASQEASIIQLGRDVVTFASATSGSAGNTISFTERYRVTAGGYFKASNDGTYAASTGNYHEFRTSASTRSPTIQNTHATQPFGILIEYTAAAPNGAGNDFVYCSDNAAARAVIRSNGGLANYQANDVNLSDERVKTNIKPVGSYWDKFKAIEIVTFKYVDQTHDDDNIGVIAQQVEAVAPEFIDVDGFGETPEDGVPLKTVYTTDLYHASIKALQEAMARIEALEARLEALEA